MTLAPDTPIFAVRERTFAWAELRAAAEVLGDWRAIERRVREGLACLRFLEADERELDGELVDATAVEFRQDRNLIAAEEMIGWLEARGLDAAAWQAYVERSVARHLHRDEVDDLVACYPVDDADVAREAEAEGICSGLLGATARKVAAAAAFAAASGRPSATAEELAAAFAELRETALRPERLAAVIAARVLDWLVLDCRVAAFADEDAAREAALCVREESEDLEHVARTAGVTVRRTTLLLEELPPEAHSRFLGAAAGDLVGPVELGGLPTLVLLAGKAPPTAADPVVRARAEQAALAAAVERAIDASGRFLLAL